MATMPHKNGRHEQNGLRFAEDNVTITGMSKQAVNHLQSKTSMPVTARTALAVLLPLVLALVVATLVGDQAGEQALLGQVPLLATLGIVSWFMGLAWYGLPGLGLRGKRPLFSGIGFAVLVWLPFLILRFFLVALNPDTPIGRGSFAGQAFFYMLLFEAFAVQLWTFGLVFRTLAEWRGGLTAAFGSGILFGMVAFTLFHESFAANLGSLLYFMLWGILYGIIRLRTGSILGIVTVQALHSFTTWIVFLPEATPDVGQLQSLYLAASAVYLFVAWRLWPKQEEDYRV